MKETRLFCDYCNKQINNTIWDVFQESEDHQNVDSSQVLIEYCQFDDSELCKALTTLYELVQTDTSFVISDILSQSLQKIISEQKRSPCTIVNAFKLYFKSNSGSHTSTMVNESEEILKDYWKYVKEKVVNMLQERESILSTSQMEELVDLNIEALKFNADKDAYTTLVNCFSNSSMPIRRMLLERLRDLNLETQSNFVLSLFEEIFTVIQELVTEQDFDELFLFNLSSDGGPFSNNAMLHTCFSFMTDLLQNTDNSQLLIQEKLASVVNRLTKYLRESYSGSHELMMNTFAEWMAHLICSIFERLQLDNLAQVSCSEEIQEFVIRVALSPLPLTATELNIRAFHCWLQFLSKPNTFSRNLFSMQIIDTTTGASVNIFIAAFDVACNDIDHRVRNAAFKVIIQALLSRNVPIEAFVVDITRSTEPIPYRNDLIENIILTSVGWPNSSDEQALSFACHAIVLALICREDCREPITHHLSCQPEKGLFFHRLLDFLKSILRENVPDSIVQHLLYLISVCLTFSDACRQLLTNRIDCLNEILLLAMSETGSLTRGLSYVVISFFLGSGCHDPTLTEYEAKLRNYKMQFRQDLMFCLDKGDTASSPLGMLYILLKGSCLSACLDMIREHWSHLFRNALITLETVPLQFSKFSEIVSSSECSFGNSSLTGKTTGNIHDLDFSVTESPTVLVSSPCLEDDIQTHSRINNSNETYSLENFSFEQDLLIQEGKVDSLSMNTAIQVARHPMDVDIKTNFFQGLQSSPDIDKFDEICARLEAVANFLERSCIAEKHKTNKGDIGNQCLVNRTSPWRQVSFDVFSLQGEDMNNGRQNISHQLSNTDISLVEKQQYFSSKFESYKSTEYLHDFSSQDYWQVAKTVEDYFEKSLDEMEEWYISSTERLKDHFQQLSGLESRVGKIIESLAMSRFHEDENMSSYKDKPKSFHGTFSSQATPYDEPQWNEEKRKQHNQWEQVHSPMIHLKNFVDGQFHKWCNYLQDEVSSRLLENSDILNHLQIQICNMKHSCSESNQMNKLLTLLFHKKNRMDDISSTTSFEEEDFFLTRDELNFLNDKLSAQRPFVALISLCVFLRDYLNITREDLRQCNDYAMHLQNENSNMKNRELRELFNRRMQELMQQKEKLYCLLEEFSKRWQQYLGNEFPEENFELVRMTTKESPRETNNIGVMKASPLGSDDDSQLRERILENQTILNHPKQHEKLLLYALRVNNMRIEKLVKMSIGNGTLTHSVTKHELVVSSDYRKLQKEHKILLAVLAELHREYRHLAKQSLQSEASSKRNRVIEY